MIELPDQQGYRRAVPGVCLAAIVALAAALRLWRLDEGGVLAPPYVAAVRSQLESWHNLFFNAFDPAGFLSLDKPPVAFWLQTLSAKLLGFGAFGVLLPQVTEGLVSILLLHSLVRRHFGSAAGLLAALFLAVCPISLMVDRSNETESCLVMVLLFAVWAFFRAVEGGGARWLLAAAAIVGIGFNTKMAVAMGIVPVFAAAYLIWAPTPLLRRGLRPARRRDFDRRIAVVERCLRCDTRRRSRPFVDGSPGQQHARAGGRVQFCRAVRWFRRARVLTGFPLASTAAALPNGPLPVRPSRPGARSTGRAAAPRPRLELAAQIGWLLSAGIDRRYRRMAAVSGRRRREHLSSDRLDGLGGGLRRRLQRRRCDLRQLLPCGDGGRRSAPWRRSERCGYGYCEIVSPRRCCRRRSPSRRSGRLMWSSSIYRDHSSSASGLVVGATAGRGVGLAAGAAIAYRSSPTARRACCAIGLIVLLSLPGAWALGISLGRLDEGFGEVKSELFATHTLRPRPPQPIQPARSCPRDSATDRLSRSPVAPAKNFSLLLSPTASSGGADHRRLRDAGQRDPGRLLQRHGFRSSTTEEFRPVRRRPGGQVCLDRRLQPRDRPRLCGTDGAGGLDPGTRPCWSIRRCGARPIQNPRHASGRAENERYRALRSAPAARRGT